MVNNTSNKQQCRDNTHFYETKHWCNFRKPSKLYHFEPLGMCVPCSCRDFYAQGLITNANIYTVCLMQTSL